MIRDTRSARLAAFAILAVAVAVLAYLAVSRDGDPDAAGPTARQSEVAAKGRTVMPFALERTTHRFEKAASGGVETVTADDSKDQTQIKLIREHLAKEASAFARGDYGDPASIHGAGMPGLKELERGRPGVRYTELPAGARITFTSSDRSLVNAVHSWFDAQTSDHGSHAEHG